MSVQESPVLKHLIRQADFFVRYIKRETGQLLVETQNSLDMFTETSKISIPITEDEICAAIAVDGKLFFGGKKGRLYVYNFF